MNKLYIFLLLFAAFFTACNDDFLEVVPKDRVSDASVWEDPELIKAFVNNIYLGQHTGFHTEMLSSACDESIDVWNWGHQPIVKCEINSSNLELLSPWHWNRSYRNLTWNNLYKNIRSCNIFLDNMSESTLEGEEIDQLKGEVLFLRAYSYHYLMSFFGGVPIIDKASGPTDDLLVERSSFANTVEFIVADCDAAAELLSSSGDKARATQGAALALKSRVLLYAASELYSSTNSWAPGYSNPELIGYTSGDANSRWQAAKDAAKAVIDLGIYGLYGINSPGSTQDAIDNCVNIFINNGNVEDILVFFYDVINEDSWDTPSPGLFNGPNGWHCWGGNIPIQQLVDDYEMNDGSKFDWNNPVHAAAPYENRDPRFYANILYDGAKWRERPNDMIDKDPEGIVQTGSYENEDGSITPGLDTRSGPIEDWNGTYTGYYMRKFIDPAIDHQYEKQKYPWRQMRYAEILLNYAEACLELGDENEAKTYINMIRSRAGMPDIPASETGYDLVERYRNERRIELAYENHRFFDIRRWMIAPEVMENVKGIDIFHSYGSSTPTYTVQEVAGRERNWDNKCYVLPILLDELNRNEKLIQNPGY